MAKHSDILCPRTSADKIMPKMNVRDWIFSIDLITTKSSKTTEFWSKVAGFLCFGRTKKYTIYYLLFLIGSDDIYNK